MTAETIAFLAGFALVLPWGAALAVRRLRRTLPAIWRRTPSDAPERTKFGTNAGGEVVYFIQLDDDGPIKIGTTHDLPRRLATLQTSAPGPLHVRAILAGGPALEAELHRRFAALHSSGEWFAPGPDLLRFLA